MGASLGAGALRDSTGAVPADSAERAAPSGTESPKQTAIPGTAPGREPPSNPGQGGWSWPPARALSAHFDLSCLNARAAFLQLKPLLPPAPGMEEGRGEPGMMEVPACVTSPR